MHEDGSPKKFDFADAGKDSSVKVEEDKKEEKSEEKAAEEDKKSDAAEEDKKSEAAEEKAAEMAAVGAELSKYASRPCSGAIGLQIYDNDYICSL